MITRINTRREVLLKHVLLKSAKKKQWHPLYSQSHLLLKTRTKPHQQGHLQLRRALVLQHRLLNHQRIRRYQRRDHFRHHCGRSGHRHDQLQDHRRSHHPRSRQVRGRPGGNGWPAGHCPGDARCEQRQRSLYCPWRPNPGSHPELEELNGKTKEKEK